MRLPSFISRPLLIAAPWLCILGLWLAIRASGLVSPALVPSPAAVVEKFIELSKDRLWLDIWMSARRVFIGVTFGILVAVPVGFCLGWYRGLRAFIDPVINFFRALPPIAQISPIFVRVARTLGANDVEIFTKIIVPLTVPHILTAIRVALGVAWATLVASELIAAQQGLGALIQNASSFFQLDVIYVGIICIGLIAMLMDLALRAASRRLVAWQDRIA
ncbi:ABC transporter permease [Achromobacter anxifer]|uniref:ABC transporter permease n=1 Tax=Achromobacter anxifer TaxID=1287737 RepID=UPI002157D94D|nr:ABC transporter permease subunit [Achromobacter anxifer]